MKKLTKTILVVEDEESLLEVISYKLKQAGFDVVTARSADQAYEYIQEIDNVDLVWLDHYLEGPSSGLDFVVRLKKAGGKSANIPVFLISNTSYPEKYQSYIALGVERYYTKSNYRLSQIIDDVQKYLTSNREG